MDTNRKVLNAIFFGLVFTSSSLFAALNLQQEVTLSSFSSEEETKKIANQFIRAAEGDPNIKVIGIKYKQEKLGKDLISYDAVIKCHVSEENTDVLRVQKKMMENNKNLIEGGIHH